MLQTIAKRLKRSTRQDDIVARLGGDEFALFFPGQHSSEARSRLEVIWKTLCQSARVKDARLRPSISMGAAFISDDAFACEELMRRADRGLYKAKHLGRGRIVFYSDILEGEIAERRSLADRLHRALSANEVGIALQPQIQLCGNEVVSFEALARWNDSKRWIPPAEFVAAAEEHGLAEHLGRAVLRKALEACRSLRGETGRYIYVAVNVGTGQLISEQFAEQVLRSLREFDLPPAALELEITETVLLDRSFTHIQPILSELRSLGGVDKLEPISGGGGPC